MRNQKNPHPETLPAKEVQSLLRKAPNLVLSPGPQFQGGSRAFQGIPSIAISPGGSFFAVWYGGKTPAEDKNNYVVLTRSRDGGKTWSKEILAIDSDRASGVRAFDPEIWFAPDGKLWVFWSQCKDHPGSNYATLWALNSENPDADEPSWSVPNFLCEGVMMCKPILRRGGEWVLPVSFWHRRETGHAGVVVSTDAGKTWEERGAASGNPRFRSFDEHMLVERNDHSLWMLARTKYGIAESFSEDGGRTWSELLPSGIPHVDSRFFISRLQSGKLLLVRHEPADHAYPRCGLKQGGTRSHLTAFLSEDEGETWPHKMLLDERFKCSYPDGAQHPDGSIHVIYDFERYASREILFASFTEEDLLGGECPGKARLKARIHQATMPLPGKEETGHSTS